MSSAAALYSVAQVRALEAYAIAQGTSAYTLMKRAGEAALRALRSRWPRALRIAVVAGGGNNSGDGYVLARFSQAAGLAVVVLAAVAPEKLRGDARQAYEDFAASGGRVRPFAAASLEQTDGLRDDVIVDALLGIGLEAVVRPPLAAAIDAINACGRPVFALDLPSGLHGDTGTVLGTAIRADCTISFVALKTGLFLGDGPERCGRLIFDDLEVVPPPAPQFRPQLERLGEAEIAQLLPPRRRDAHKGEFGRVLLIAGGAGMAGAARLAGEACLRVGAGLVTVATTVENATAIAIGRPELISLGVSAATQLHEPLQAADVVAIGPGLGRSAWARALFAAALECGKPLVIDADALNLLAESGAAAPPNSILTPHPGEAGRLLNSSSAQIQQDRMAALRALTRRHPGVIVLKGAGTLIGAQDRIAAICERGNPGMASPGMGDVLTGATAGILAQCRDTYAAARAAVLVHALAGDELARESGRGMLALDLAQHLAHWVNLRA